MSKKNSRQILQKNDGRRFIAKSFAAMRSDDLTIWDYKQAAPTFREATKDLPLPLFVKFTFIMSKDTPFDWLNIGQSVADQMQKAGWVRNDNRHYLMPIFENKVYISPEHAGVVITIL